MNFVAIDFETANSKRSSACELGIVVVKNWTICEKHSWLIKPTPFEFEHHSCKGHGIREAEVEASPTFNDLWPIVSHYFDGRVIFAHNAAFDRSVLDSSLGAHGIPVPNCEFRCTCDHSRRTFPSLVDHRLETIAQHLGFEFTPHRALPDAEACARVAIHIERLAQLGSRSAAESKTLSRQATRRLDGLHFAFTIDLSDALPKREILKEIIEQAGGIVTSGPTKKTNYLVVGVPREGQPTSTGKLEKGREMKASGHPIELINEATFVELVFGSDETT